MRRNYHRKVPPKTRSAEKQLIIRNGNSGGSGQKSRMPFLVQEQSEIRVRVIGCIEPCLKIMVGIATVTVISCLFIFLHDFFTQCDYFNAQNITTEGLNRLSRRQVMEQARVTPGMNILSLNLPKTRKRLLAHSWIAEADVQRELPGMIHIRIREQKPLGVLDLGRKFIINAEGEIFKEWAEADGDTFPEVSGLGFSDLGTPRRSRSLPFKAVIDILHMGQQPESIIPCKMIQRIRVDTEMGLTLELENPSEPGNERQPRLWRYPSGSSIQTIRLGYHNYADKYDRIESILSYLGREENKISIDSIDLNNLNRIVVNSVPLSVSADGCPLTTDN
jgi:cell division protein FtsQ